MSTADIQILIFSLNDVLDPSQTILSFGIIFANQYHLPVPNRIIRNRGKKPRFDNEGVYFSVSHSGKYWICAFSDMPIGVDIQQHKTCKNELIARRFFHPKEAQWLKNKPLPFFFDVWTAKESYVKYNGQGITDQFSAFSVVNNGTITQCGHAFLQHVFVGSDYSLCVCSPIPAHVTLIMK